MKELKLSKYSKAWFKKRNNRLTKLVIVLFWFIPIFGAVLASFNKLKNIAMSIAMSIVVVFIFMLNLAMLLYITDSINEKYDDYIYRLISKQKRKQDRKWKKWLI